MKEEAGTRQVASKVQRSPRILKLLESAGLLHRIKSTESRHGNRRNDEVQGCEVSPGQ
jgi:hypothetical protein